MIDLAVPTDTLALFNLRQYFKKNSKDIKVKIRLPKLLQISGYTLH